MKTVTITDKDIAQLINECGQHNWDCYGALPIDLNSCTLAQLFLDTLPKDIERPSVGVDLDGEVCLDWCKDYHGYDRHLMSISVGPTGTLSWASHRSSTDSDSGSETLNLTSIPEKILKLLPRT